MEIRSIGNTSSADTLPTNNIGTASEGFQGLIDALLVGMSGENLMGTANLGVTQDATEGLTKGLPKEQEAAAALHTINIDGRSVESFNKLALELKLAFKQLGLSHVASSDDDSNLKELIQNLNGGKESALKKLSPGKILDDIKRLIANLAEDKKTCQVGKRQEVNEEFSALQLLGFFPMAAQESGKTVQGQELNTASYNIPSKVDTTPIKFEGKVKNLEQVSQGITKVLLDSVPLKTEDISENEKRSTEDNSNRIDEILKEINTLISKTSQAKPSTLDKGNLDLDKVKLPTLTNEKLSHQKGEGNFTNDKATVNGNNNDSLRKLESILENIPSSKISKDSINTTNSGKVSSDIETKTSKEMDLKNSETTTDVNNKVLKPIINEVNGVLGIKTKKDISNTVRQTDVMKSDIEPKISKLSEESQGNTVDKQSFVNEFPVPRESANTVHENHSIDNLPQINKDEILELTVNRFKAVRLPDVTEVKVKLRPEELGEITIKVVLEKGQVSGNILASNRDVANIIQNNLDTLRFDLKNNNINLNSLSVNVNSSGDYSGQNPGQFSNGRNNRHTGAYNGYSETSSETITNETEDDRLNIIA